MTREGMKILISKIDTVGMAPSKKSCTAKKEKKTWSQPVKKSGNCKRLQEM